MNILVTGATGAVGPRVVQALAAAGYRIRTLSLDQPSKGQWPDDVETRIGDVTDKSAVQSAMQGVEAVTPRHATDRIRQATDNGLRWLWAVDRGLSVLHAYLFPSWVGVVVADLKSDRSV